MSLQVKGILHKIMETESKSDKFQSRDFIIETDGKYPQYVKFQLMQDKCGLIDAFTEGEEIEVFFDLRGREWQGKYFTNLNAWKVSEANKAPDTPFIEPKNPAPVNDSELFTNF